MVGGGAPVVPPCVWWLGAWFSNGDTIAFHDDGGRSAKTYSNAKKQILASLPCNFEDSNGFQIASHLVGQYMKIPGDPNRSPWLSQCSYSITILFGSCSWLQSLLRLMAYAIWKFQPNKNPATPMKQTRVPSWISHHIRPFCWMEDDEKWRLFQRFNRWRKCYCTSLECRFGHYYWYHRFLLDVILSCSLLAGSFKIDSGGFFRWLNDSLPGRRCVGFSQSQGSTPPILWWFMLIFILRPCHWSKVGEMICFSHEL